MQEFTAAESAALRRLTDIALGVRPGAGSRNGLSASDCAMLVEFLTGAPAVPTPSLCVQDSRAVALLAMFAEVLRYIHNDATEGARTGGLSLKRTRVVGELANMVHNVPRIVEGTYWMPFNERWFINTMRWFDQGAGTQLEAIYQAALDSQPKPSRKAFRPRQKPPQMP
jgi:hypothetical protein